jgi:hypothetical protein
MHQEKTVKIQKGKLILNSGRCVSCNYVHDCTNPLIEQVCELSEQALKKKNVLALIQENRHLPCPIMLLSMGSVVFGVKFCVVLNAGACR